MASPDELLAASPLLRAALEARAPRLCDACLGRTFARMGEPTGNAARGRALRGLLGTPAAPACDLCDGLLDRVPAWIRLCTAAAEGFEYDTFLVGSVTFDAIRTAESELYANLAAAHGPDLPAVPARPNAPPWPPAEWLKTEVNREVGRGIEAATGKRVDFERPDLTFRLDTRFDHVDLQVADLYVRGRYRKFVRDLPQTRWPCRACGGLGCRQCGGTGKTYESSVEELVAAPFLEASGASGEAFHGMGREDIDARTLGTGRPFILELKRPHRRSLDWRGLEDQVNRANVGRVEVEGIAQAGHEDAARYKAADPVKTYHAACTADAEVPRQNLEAALARLSGVSLEQRTPQRVSHRRADLVRRRTVHELKLLTWSPTAFTIEVHADSGTYIKEFVSGDEGRTTPSLAATLGIPTRVAALDVVDVDWREPTPPEGPG